MKANPLAEREFAPYKAGAVPLKGADLEKLSAQLEGWEVVNEHHLVKNYKFPDFATALAHVNRIGELAERAGHHPDLQLAWGRVGVEIWTHSVGGLTENDFILAAKIEMLSA